MNPLRVVAEATPSPRLYCIGLRVVAVVGGGFGFGAHPVEHSRQSVAASVPPGCGQSTYLQMRVERCVCAVVRIGEVTAELVSDIPGRSSDRRHQLAPDPALALKGAAAARWSTYLSEQYQLRKLLKFI
jgi:hypothetical protein